MDPAKQRQIAESKNYLILTSNLTQLTINSKLKQSSKFVETDEFQMGNDLYFLVNGSQIKKKSNKKIEQEEENNKNSNNNNNDNRKKNDDKIDGVK